jgi:hypothetical protein
MCILYQLYLKKRKVSDGVFQVTKPVMVIEETRHALSTSETDLIRSNFIGA